MSLSLQVKPPVRQFGFFHIPVVFDACHSNKAWMCILSLISSTLPLYPQGTQRDRDCYLLTERSTSHKVELITALKLTLGLLQWEAAPEFCRLDLRKAFNSQDGESPRRAPGGEKRGSTLLQRSDQHLLLKRSWSQPWMGDQNQAGFEACVFSGWGSVHGSSSGCLSEPHWYRPRLCLMTMPEACTVRYTPHLKGCWDDLGFLAQHWPHSIEVLVSDFSVQLFSWVQLEFLGLCGEIFATLTLLLRGKLLRREFHICYQMQRDNPGKDWSFPTVTSAKQAAKPVSLIGKGS